MELYYIHSWTLIWQPANSHTYMYIRLACKMAVFVPEAISSAQEGNHLSVHTHKHNLYFSWIEVVSAIY